MNTFKDRRSILGSLLCADLVYGLNPATGVGKGAMAVGPQAILIEHSWRVSDQFVDYFRVLLLLNEVGNPAAKKVDECFFRFRKHWATGMVEEKFTVPNSSSSIHTGAAR